MTPELVSQWLKGLDGFARASPWHFYWLRLVILSDTAVAFDFALSACEWGDSNSLIRDTETRRNLMRGLQIPMGLAAVLAELRAKAWQTWRDKACKSKSAGCWGTWRAINRLFQPHNLSHSVAAVLDKLTWQEAGDTSSLSSLWLTCNEILRPELGRNRLPLGRSPRSIRALMPIHPPKVKPGAWRTSSPSSRGSGIGQAMERCSEALGLLQTECKDG